CARDQSPHGLDSW
nr:immunoglobulin heavy chain junction region [Macaca mulatta]MOW93414.1 immunoglobulin heavy chain junction region [Macaca mulatta]MOW93493.1 immunoglobulin heavy chain junction region [Macaca mulatta]MOW93660.1 immunoglobulin heavy chain junction region [Macaca mulatta]MOW93675.1 immunoglobulin heavy chain junction region [Macaca mulatta]